MKPKHEIGDLVFYIDYGKKLSIKSAEVKEIHQTMENITYVIENEEVCMHLNECGLFRTIYEIEATIDAAIAEARAAIEFEHNRQCTPT